jgi:hypothetical protein
MVLGFAAPAEWVKAHLGLQIAHIIDEKGEPSTVSEN